MYMNHAKSSYHDAIMWCSSKNVIEDQYQCGLKMIVSLILLLDNSKILPYTVQGFCYIIFTKMIEQNTVYVIDMQRCTDTLIRTYINRNLLHQYSFITYHDVS